MTARLRLNEKKGICIMLLFFLLSIYSFLTEAQFFWGSNDQLYLELQAFIPTDVTSTPNISDYNNFSAKTRFKGSLGFFLRTLVTI
jgi:hypothetical protein